MILNTNFTLIYSTIKIEEIFANTYYWQIQQIFWTQIDKYHSIFNSVSLNCYDVCQMFRIIWNKFRV